MKQQRRSVGTILAFFSPGALFGLPLGVALGGLISLGGLSGCKDMVLAPPPGDVATSTCDPSLCAPGNECLSDGSQTKCRLVCDIGADGTGGQASCPSNYSCVGGAPKAYCRADRHAYAKKETGQWGSTCPASGGFSTNEACDLAQNFWCYGTSPVDAAAFCTQFDCTDDADCRGGWWCATVNTAPSVTHKIRSTGTTQRVCLPRTYCATCTADVDCPDVNGTRQHCVDDAAGEKLCAPECTSNSNCNSEAKCAAIDTLDAKVCQPRAGACKGDGALCAPCLSDADCPMGTCASSQYSTEHYCTVKSTVPCAVVNNMLVAGCPVTNQAKVPVSCSTTAFGSDPSIGKDQCFGLVSIGTGANQGMVPGCFSPAR